MPKKDKKQTLDATGLIKNILEDQFKAAQTRGNSWWKYHSEEKPEPNKDVVVQIRGMEGPWVASYDPVSETWFDPYDNEWDNVIMWFDQTK